MSEPMEGTPSGVGSAQITDGSIETADLKNGSVTPAKLSDEVVVLSAGESVFAYLNFI